jgi:large subunit ribosomal protein L30
MASKKAPEKAPEKAPATTPEPAPVKITQVRSTIGARWNQRESLRSLGLRRLRQSVVRQDNAQTRGLLGVVGHLVKVEAVQPSPAGQSGSQEVKK